MDIVIDIHDGVVLEPCPCCGSPAQPLRVENALEVFYVIACSNTQAPTGRNSQSTLRSPSMNDTWHS